MNLIERLRTHTMCPTPEECADALESLNKEVKDLRDEVVAGDQDIERLTAERDEVREALRIMLLQSPYQDGEGGHRYQACQMAQDALDHVPNVGKMVGQGAGK